MITRKKLQYKVDIINEKTGRHFFLDYNSYYGGYYLSENRGNSTARWDTEDLRMSAAEMCAYLKGIIWGLSNK